MAKAKVKSQFADGIKKSDVTDYSPHLMTLGAYVQQPDPRVVGLSEKEVIGSQDAKSLYPTIMVLMNIGYDTLRGRIYDMAIVGNLIDAIRMLHDLPLDKLKEKQSSILDLGNKFAKLAKEYAESGNLSSKLAKGTFVEYIGIFYKNIIRQLIEYRGNFQDILQPRDNETYFLLKSCLYPLLETMTWIHKLNKGYSQVAVDWVFYNHQFDAKYTGKNFLVIHNINSVSSQAFFLTLDGMKNHILTKYIINPYGTYFDKHSDNLSFEVNNILQGMDDRAYVKNQHLIIGAILENWKLIPEENQRLFLSKLGRLEEHEADSLVNIVGDADEKSRNKQKQSLMNVRFNYEYIEHVYKGLELQKAQKKSKENGIKVTLNSGYGLFGMSTWSYGSSLISNSITNGGKVYGTKLFQNIAVNRLTVENEKINSGFYNKQ